VTKKRRDGFVYPKNARWVVEFRQIESPVTVYTAEEVSRVITNGSWLQIEYHDGCVETFPMDRILKVTFEPEGDE
jgi:hypothetical protein